LPAGVPGAYLCHLQVGNADIHHLLQRSLHCALELGLLNKGGEQLKQLQQQSTQFHHQTAPNTAKQRGFNKRSASGNAIAKSLANTKCEVDLQT
jgi:hypothetical protein